MSDVKLYKHETVLHVKTTKDVAPYDDYLGRSQIMRYQVTIRIIMTIRCADVKQWRYTVNYQSFLHNDDEQTRQELLRYKWLEVDVWAPRDWVKPDWQNVKVEVHDPHGVIPWLFNDPTEFFKQTFYDEQQRIAQPLRLPAGPEGSGKQ